MNNKMYFLCIVLSVVGTMGSLITLENSHLKVFLIPMCLSAGSLIILSLKRDWFYSTPTQESQS